MKGKHECELPTCAHVCLSSSCSLLHAIYTSVTIMVYKLAQSATLVIMNAMVNYLLYAMYHDNERSRKLN